ncbi:MAG TPA: DUF3611 family protein [Methylocystis sp.]|nr:DUF3611 family protein [Methylocystis sp.]
MPSRATRYALILILFHWLVALASLALLGLGLWLRYSPTTTKTHDRLASLHVSLGLSTAILLGLTLMFRLVLGAPASPQELGPWRRVASGAVNGLLYVSLLILLASGYLRETFNATPVEFWGLPLPIWAEADEGLAQQMALAHEYAAYAFAGLVVLHLLLVVANSFASPGFSRRMLPLKPPAEAPSAPLLSPSPGALGAKIAAGLAREMKLFGWVQFWLQFLLAFACALLLQFVTSGRMLSSLHLGWGDAMHWAIVSLGFLCVTCALGFIETRFGAKIARFPDYFLGGARPRGFWRLTFSLALSLIGLVVAFIGIGLSITLLIAKTVSQPPGIAITDPNKIIRALDVFVLLTNFNLLVAHFVGFGTSLWLRIEAGRARFDYYRATEAPLAPVAAAPATQAGAPEAPPATGQQT